MAEAATRRAARGTGRRKYDPEGTRTNIIAVAMKEFAENGLSGARIDEIAAKTRTSKRMIYYYFGDKAGLYRHVLESAYGRVRTGEAALRLDDLPPDEALRRLVDFTFTHHSANPDFIRLVMIENIHHGKYLAESATIEKLNADAIEHIARIYRAGTAQGLFREGLQPLELHWLISALSFFNVSNRATFTTIFGASLHRSEAQAGLKRHAIEMVLRFVLRPHLIDPPPRPGALNPT
ncbi:MAG: TetR/AcrR family transcriptional regulator [Sneathiellaceae bacterium]